MPSSKDCFIGLLDHDVVPFEGNLGVFNGIFNSFVRFVLLLVAVFVEARNGIALQPLNLRHLLVSDRLVRSFEVRNGRIHEIFDQNEKISVVFIDDSPDACFVHN